MPTRLNKNQEYLANSIWQRNLNDARNIHVNVDDLLDAQFSLLHDVLKNFEISNGTDPAGLLLSLFTCVGHLAGNSEVTITNHNTNLNIFVLLIGPSGSGKSKIISPIKKSIITAMQVLGLSKDDSGILDDFTSASLSAKLAKSNVFIITDEAEKPLLELGFYSPLSEASAGDRISSCKFFGTIPTSKDTMTYHLDIVSHLSFVGATTGRLWPRLVNYYTQGYQSDGMSERFVHYAMPKRNDSKLNYSHTLEYDDANDDNNDEEEDISDNEYKNESTNKVDQHLPSLSQIFIVSSLIGKRIFHLSRTGTKKFYNKVRQYQELSQIDKPDDINYGSRMGKSAEILCKFAAIAELINITLDILKILRGQNQLEHNDTSLTFIRNITYIIENKYPSTNMILEIKSPSCRLTGQLLCSHLLKMLFAFYNVNPVQCNLETNMNPTTSIQSTINNIQQRIIQMPQLIFLKRDLTGPMGLLRHFPTDLVNSVLTELVNCELIRQGPFITTSRRATIFIRSYPSDPVLNDSLKRNTIDQILNDINIDLTTYMHLLCNSIIKDKQILTNTAKQILMLPEHKFLCEKLKEKYPERHLENNITINSNDNLNNPENNFVNNQITTDQPTNNQKILLISSKETSHHHVLYQNSNLFNQLPLQSQSTLQIDQDSHDISTSHNADTISIIFEPSKENTIIEQIDTLPTVVNAFDQKQEITSVLLSAHLFNTNTSSIPNEASSSTQQFHMIDKSNDKSLNPKENLNDNDQILIDNDQNNINSTYSREIHNLTSNVEVRNITSPITNILLPTSLMLGIVDQILSNNSNKSMSITSTQPQINHTTGMNTFPQYFYNKYNNTPSTFIRF
ncbi:unnamed protein product [Rotaria magnacalcarata]|uniref:Uncharacterized protein n=1 Tax=Rotaria magnacalcarata TaxID=392030 RepID=A0A816RC60_9BILA|nr:unnamed protein product [Rotaria magnacalcarata]